MKNKIVLSLAAILTVSSLSAADLLKDIKTDISDSVRFTANDDTNKNLNATTNKLKVNLTGDVKVVPQTTFELEVTDVRNIDDEIGSELFNGEEQTKLNRINFTTQLSQIDSVVKVGRQAVTLDKGSLISNNPWNLMETSVDGVALINNSIKGLTLTGAHGWQVNPTDTEKNVKLDFTLLNAKYNIIDGISISAYDYMIEDHSDTYGALFDVNKTDKGLTYLMTAEYNKQKDSTIGDATNVDAKFYDVNAGLGALGTEVRVGYTVSKDGFDAPLGNSHEYLGTSDMVGHGDVKSTYVTLNSELTKELSAETSFHTLKTESTGDKLGNELDLGLGYQVHENVKLMAKTALFNSYANSGLNDNDKTWVEMKVSF